MPCLYCLKKKEHCVPQAAAPKTGVIFVNTSASPLGARNSRPFAQTISTVQKFTSAPSICSNVSQEKSSLFIKHFFSNFLVRNDFGGNLDLDTIISEFQKSPSLYHASIAVGALDLSYKFALPSMPEKKGAELGALTAYRTSVLDFQKDIGSKRIQQSDASLWTTFFLGLFEVQVTYLILRIFGSSDTTIANV